MGSSSEKEVGLKRNKILFVVLTYLGKKGGGEIKAFMLPSFEFLL